MTLLPSNTYYPIKLKDYISHFSYYEVNQDTHESTFMLPLGTVQIIFQTKGSTFHNTSFTVDWETRPEVFIGGPYEAGYQMKFSGTTGIFCLIFKVGKSRHFMSFGTDHLTNQLVHPEELWGQEGKELIEKIFASNGNLERIHILEEFLLSRLKPLDRTPMEQVIAILYSNKGITSINKLRSISGFSKTHFRRKFKEDIGLNPKQLRKIVRINAAVNCYLKNPKLNFTELAYHFDFFDQSHFIKEFKSVTGQAPRDLLPSSRV